MITTDFFPKKNSNQWAELVVGELVVGELVVGDLVMPVVQVLKANAPGGHPLSDS